MKNKLGNIIVIIVFVVIVSVSLFYIFKDGVQNSIKLGLDLKGGTQIILKPVEKGTVQGTDEAINKAELIILNRIDKLGISEPLVTRDLNKDIIVQLPGVSDPQKAIEIIGKLHSSKFKILENGRK